MNKNITLHIGATKTAPSQNSGVFLCNNKSTAPPIDSPNKYLILHLFSSLSNYFNHKQKDIKIIFW